MPTRVDQEGIELLVSATTANARVNQEGIELLVSATTANARVDQLGIELLVFIGAVPLSQAIMIG